MKKIVLLLGLCFNILFSSPINLETTSNESLDFFLYNLEKSKSFDTNSEAFLAYMAKAKFKLYEAQGKYNNLDRKEKLLIDKQSKKFWEDINNEFEANEVLAKNKNFMLDKMAKAEDNIKNKEFFLIKEVKRDKYNFNEEYFPFFVSKYIMNDKYYFHRLDNEFYETYLNLIDESDKKAIYKYFNFPIKKDKAKEHISKYKYPNGYYLRFVYKVVDSKIGVPGDSSYSKDFINYNTTKPIIGNSSNGKKTNLSYQQLKTITDIKLIRIELLVKTAKTYDMYKDYDDKNIKILYTKNL
ncbi:hypothetical protein CP965_12985 [Halarcobacter mediterraneus]|uniref:Uncharacterized protein n=1 Tax=Halarcobacter mediterraneus TaxID=2023153 RepID=A0A4Q1AW55_9BACT|nr:hypothetical protein [Halarcobacter mediterraneus]RXK11679.1 hypothetical protein CP965_12985 [Halarcobacter mediterraneus]